ncbi:MAG: glycosyl hydrolase 108 family protein [Candidatus Caldarchaeum sp.]
MFDKALSFTLKWEGGYSNHPSDPGGATNMGITQSTYDAWRNSKGLPKQDVKNLTRDEAARIYRERYWDPLKVDNANPALALIAFDSAVNHGVSTSLKWLSESNGDWRKFAAIRLEFYTKLRTWEVFGRGWTRRLADCIKECIELDQPKRLFVNGVMVGPVDRMSYVGDKLYIAVRRGGGA